MSLKQTRLWKYLKRKKNFYMLKKTYLKMKNMPLDCYEDFLTKRTYEMMLRKTHSNKYAYNINFEHPLTFTEKRQWMKLYDQDPRKTIYTDKYEVRNHIKNIIGEDYLIPLITINGKDCFESIDEIDFNLLPNSFVIKCTHGSHMNIIVKNKADLSPDIIKKYKKQINKWMHTNYAYVVALELQYKDIKPRIIIEHYIDFNNKSLTDYKFFCFSGEPKFVGIFENRWTENYTESYLDMNFKKTSFRLDNYPDNPSIKKPVLFEKMIEISRILCENFLMVRVDLYMFNNKIFFGELTFSSASGFDFPNPFSDDLILGELIKIDYRKREGNYTYRKYENN